MASDASHHDGCDEKEQGGQGRGRALEAFKGLEIWVIRHMTY